MKSFTIASIVALASVATAQLDNIPSCALNCFVGPLTSDGCSSLTDFACHCQKGPALLASVQPCVEGACSAADQAAAISAVESTCSAAGVPISIPDSASSAAPSETSTTVVTATSEATVVTATSEVSTTVVTATSEVSTTVVTATSEATSAAASAVSSAISGGNATTSATLSQFTGGAAQATQAVGILGAAALAMLAL